MKKEELDDIVNILNEKRDLLQYNLDTIENKEIRHKYEFAAALINSTKWKLISNFINKLENDDTKIYKNLYKNEIEKYKNFLNKINESVNFTEEELKYYKFYLD